MVDRISMAGISVKSWLAQRSAKLNITGVHRILYQRARPLRRNLKLLHRLMSCIKLTRVTAKSESPVDFIMQDKLFDKFNEKPPWWHGLPIKFSSETDFGKFDWMSKLKYFD